MNLLVARVLICLLLILFSGLLAARGMDGWGWFLFAGILAIPMWHVPDDDAS